MGVRVSAANFRARLKKAAVLFCQNIGRLQRPREAGPAGAGIIFVQRTEQRLPGHDIDIDALLFVVDIFVLKGRLRRALLRHIVLRGRKRLLQGLIVRFSIGRR